MTILYILVVTRLGYICPGLWLLPLTTQVYIHTHTPVAQVTSRGATICFEITNHRCSHKENVALQILEFRLLVKDMLTSGVRTSELLIQLHNNSCPDLT